MKLLAHLAQTALYQHFPMSLNHFSLNFPGNTKLKFQLTISSIHTLNYIITLPEWSYSAFTAHWSNFSPI